METEVKIPAVGESISSGVLSAWLKKDGDRVEEGEVLFTLETDKVSTEILAPHSGILRIKIPEAQEVKIGEAVAVIQETAPNEPSEPIPVSKPAQVPLDPVTEGGSSSQQEQVPLQEPPEIHEAAPFVGLNLEPVTAQQLRVTRKRLSPLRRKIASQLVMSQQTAAMLTTFNECDLSAFLKMRANMQEVFQNRHGVKLGIMSVFVKASVAALKAVPQINARIEGDDLIENHYYDIGVAVGTDRGLMVPVVRDADSKSFAEIERDILQFATKAREGKIKIEDLQGGVFTISNGGVYGSMLSTPILNAPQSGILGLHRIQERPVAINGAVVIRPMMYLALSYDHRVVDGREAVTFLAKIKEMVEAPVRLLFEI